MKRKKLTTNEKDRRKILIHCMRQFQFCQKASNTFTPIPGQSESMQAIYDSFSKIFSSLAKDFEIISQLYGLKIDLKSKEGELLLEEMDSFFQKAIFDLNLKNT